MNCTVLQFVRSRVSLRTNCVQYKAKCLWNEVMAFMYILYTLKKGVHRAHQLPPIYNVLSRQPSQASPDIYSNGKKSDT